MNFPACSVRDIFLRVAPASQPGIQTHCLTRRLGFFVAAVALLAISPLAKAQTTFVGSWIQYVPGIYEDSIDEINVQSWSGEPWLRPGYSYIGIRSYNVETIGGGERVDIYQWRRVLQEPAQIPQTDNHWNNANVWTDGVPSGTTDARITKSGSLVLPTINETTAVARSLTVFDADNTNSVMRFELQNGALSLTPTSAFDTALRVGVANANGEHRYNELVLNNSSLTSSGFAEIGKGSGQAGSGELYAKMNIGNGSGWFHPAGLIELGGDGGKGNLWIEDGGLLAGSLLPGAAIDPRLVIRPESFLDVSSTGTVRLSELIVNSGYWEVDIWPASYGVWIAGHLDAGLLHLGESAQGTALLNPYSDARIGQIIIENSSLLRLSVASVSAASIDINDGVLSEEGGNLTVGTAGDPGTTTIMTLGRDSGSSGLLRITGNGLEGATVTVHGAVQLGRDGHASLKVDDGSSMTINGHLSIASNGAGDGELHILGTVSAQNISVGTNASDMDYGGIPDSPSPAGQATLRVEGGTLNVTGTSVEMEWPFPHTIHNAGSLNLGSNDLLEGFGTIAFTSPDGGRLQAIGTVAPGLAWSGYDHTGGLLIQGNLKLSNATFALGRAFGTLKIDLGGNAAGQFDVLHVTGNADIDGATLEISLLDGYAPQPGATFYFLPVDGLLTGMFGTVIDHTGLGLTLADLSLAPGGGVMLTMPVFAIPEVGTILPALGAALLAGWRLRRKWRR